MREKVLASALAIAALLASAPVRADAPPDAEHIAFAAREHDLGYAAYTAKRYDEAATHFENAFFAAPNPQELKAAMRARRDAKEYARAATLAAIALRRYDGDAAMKKAADDAIAEARPHVFEVNATCTEACDIAVDGKLVPDEKATHVRFFVDPGHHDLEIGFEGDRSTAKRVEATAGGGTSLAVAAPPKAEPSAPAKPVPLETPAPNAAPPQAEPVPNGADEHPTAGTKPFGPAVFITALALTAVAGGVTIWSGIDTQNNPGKDAVLRDCVGLGTSCPEYQDGLSAQRRTNVLLGVTGGLAVVTAVVGVFFTQWSHPAKRSSPIATLQPVLELWGSTHGVGVAGSF